MDIDSIAIILSGSCFLTYFKNVRMALPQSHSPRQDQSRLQDRPVHLRRDPPRILAEQVPIQRFLQHVRNLRRDLPLHEPLTEQDLRQDLLLPTSVQHFSTRLSAMRAGMADILRLVLHFLLAPEADNQGHLACPCPCTATCDAIWPIFVLLAAYTDEGVVFDACCLCDPAGLCAFYEDAFVYDCQPGLPGAE